MDRKQWWAGAVAAILSTAATPAMSIELGEAWRAAVGRSPALRATQLDQVVADKRLQVSRSLWNPSVMLGLFGGVAGSETTTKGARFSAREFGDTRIDGASFSTSVSLGVSGRAAISAIQPLIDPERTAMARQLGLSTEFADAGSALAQQFLAATLVERYLDLLTAREMVRLTGEQEQVLARADQELRRRQAMGDVSVMDVRESSARIAAIRANRVGLESSVQVAQRHLEELVGPLASPPPPPRLARPIQSLTTVRMDTLLAQMRSQHPQIRLFDLQRQMALYEVDKFIADRKAIRVDAVASASHERLMGAGEIGQATNRGTQHMVGVQVTIPLSSGGYRSAKQEEAIVLADRVLLERDQAVYALERGILSASAMLSAAEAKLSMLNQALESSQARLLETRKAHANGARSTLELLGAEDAVLELRKALFQEKIAVVRARTGLMANAGQLSESELLKMNQYLY
jgi:outer membrane protein